MGWLWEYFQKFMILKINAFYWGLSYSGGDEKAFMNEVNSQHEFTVILLVWPVIEEWSINYQAPYYSLKYSFWKWSYFYGHFFLLPVVGPTERWWSLWHLAHPCCVALGRAWICGCIQNWSPFLGLNSKSECQMRVKKKLECTFNLFT